MLVRAPVFRPLILLPNQSVREDKLTIVVTDCFRIRLSFDLPPRDFASSLTEHLFASHLDPMNRGVIVHSLLSQLGIQARNMTGAKSCLKIKTTDWAIYI